MFSKIIFRSTNGLYPIQVPVRSSRTDKRGTGRGGRGCEGRACGNGGRGGGTRRHTRGGRGHTDAPHLPSVLDITGSAELRTRMDTQLPMICGERAEGAGQPRGGRGTRAQPPADGHGHGCERQDAPTPPGPSPARRHRDHVASQTRGHFTSVTG